jgi:hypothetical protein
MNKTEQTQRVADYTAMAAHHTECAKAESDSSDAHSKLKAHFEVSDPLAADAHSKLADCHKAKAASHVEAAQHCLNCAKAVAQMPTEEGSQGGVDRGNSELKASIDRLNDNLSKMVTGPNVSAVPMFDNPHFVPRTGAPQNQQERELAKSKVSPQLAEVLGVDGDAQHVG